MKKKNNFTFANGDKYIGQWDLGYLIK